MIVNFLKKFGLIFLAFLIVFLLFLDYKKEYTGDYAEWGELLKESNATELLEDNNIPYKIKDGIIYIPEDAFDKAIYCCA
ncbi:hypothetical protein SAMN05421839_10274 [Halolactibacillus halophilus]|uniref:Lipoprotein YvzJ n=1 Tax=Halolactibacillus halophilus TaxID=306540 RepID=A0A1I5LJ31_9BACI|nr:hypothetical protein [Halolactibacillus halophilus]GEM00818.1 putative lipoprotein YvzJ [Halolactibacillus halophilus]SFO96751.1 hypothetical protein SAMN05421839_10274 [Halolactibacillus halophilus]